MEVRGQRHAPAAPNPLERPGTHLTGDWSGPEGSRKLKIPDFMTTAQDVGKVVSLTHRPPLHPGNTLTTWCYTWFIYGHKIINYIIVNS